LTKEAVSDYIYKAV